MNMVSWTRKQFCSQGPWGLSSLCLLRQMVRNACPFQAFGGSYVTGVGWIVFEAAACDFVDLGDTEFAGQVKNGRPPISNGKRILQTRIR